jgi:hypothetical protein
MELLQENLGIKFKKARKRIKMGSEDEDSGDDEREGSHRELPDIDQVTLVEYIYPTQTITFYNRRLVDMTRSGF